MWKTVKDAIPNKIKDKLWYSQENVLSFEGFKKVVLRINNDCWRRLQDKRNKAHARKGSYDYLPKLLKQESTKPFWSEGKRNSAE